MNVNLSTGGFAFTSGGAGPVHDGAAKPTTDRTTDPNVTAVNVLSTIHTTVELKAAELQGEPVSASDEQAIKSLERALKAVEGKNTTFEYSIHKETKQLMVKVLDKDTGELIREVPSEKVLDMVANMMKLAGLIIDERR